MTRSGPGSDTDDLTLKRLYTESLLHTKNKQKGLITETFLQWCAKEDLNLHVRNGH
jgi:hypothetical protein